MRAKRTTRFRGENNVPIKVVSEKLGVPYGIVYSRCVNGLETGDDIEKSPGMKRASNKKLTRITLGDKTMTVREWAGELGITESAVRMRYSRNRSLETKNSHGITKLSSENRINPSTIRGRLRRGMTIEEALSTPVEKGRPSAVIEINGVKKRKSQWMAENGISRSLVSLRLSTGWSLEDAVSTPPHRKPTPPSPEDYKNMVSVVNGGPVLRLGDKNYTPRDLRAIAAQLRSMQGGGDNESDCE